MEQGHWLTHTNQIKIKTQQEVESLLVHHGSYLDPMRGILIFFPQGQSLPGEVKTLTFKLHGKQRIRAKDRESLRDFIQAMARYDESSLPFATEHLSSN